MEYVPQNKIALHLKLGKKLASFVKVGFYFEQRTFDWLKLEKSNDLITVSLVRSFDEGNVGFNNVWEFKTVNELDEEENKHIKGDFETIERWIFENFGLKMDNFFQIDELDDKYTELVKENKLGVNFKDDRETNKSH
ncbi:hypothetical protein [Aquimarina sp. SS2-1]|uniref:hypothetical protein n=1 Tax=Aquimarina besae TaxID=3342247 RepID=UPI00366EA240